MIVLCQYCGERAEFVDSSAVYTRSYGMIYLCRPCEAYVGVHRGTKRPKGSLANAELREWRKRAHAAFDPIWQCGPKQRTRAYRALAAVLHLPAESAHIGMFDEEQCIRLLEAVEWGLVHDAMESPQFERMV